MTVDVRASIGSNLYFDDIKQDGRWINQRKTNSKGDVLEETGYAYYGATENGLLIACPCLPHTAEAAPATSYLCTSSTSHPPAASISKSASFGIGSVGGEARLCLWWSGGSFRDAEPLLRNLAVTMHHIGASGAGATMKLIGNLLVAAQMASLGEALALVRRAGLGGRVEAIASKAASVMAILIMAAPA